MKQMTKMQWFLIVLAIFLVSVNLRPAVTSIGPLLNTIMEDLNVSNTQMSLLTSIPVFCMGLFAPLAVPFHKRLGYKWSINLLLIGIGISTAARLFFTSFAALIITSFVAGVCIAIISPMINAYIKEKFQDNFGPIIGVYSLAIGFGAMISAGLTGVFYEQFQNSWPSALSIWGILAAVAVVVWSVAISDREQQIEKVEESQNVRNPWKNKKIWTILLFFGFQTSLFFSLTTWLSPMGIEKGMDLVTAGSVITVMSIVQMIGNIVIPSLLNRYQNIVAWLYGLIAVGLLGVLVLFIDSQYAIWAGAIILGVSLSGLFPIGLMMPLQESQNEAEAHSFSSMVFSGGFMMSAIVPLLIGFVYDFTGTHVVSKVILVVICIAMFITVAMYAKESRSV